MKELSCLVDYVRSVEKAIAMKKYRESYILLWELLRINIASACFLEHCSKWTEVIWSHMKRDSDAAHGSSLQLSTFTFLHLEFFRVADPKSHHPKVCGRSHSLSLHGPPFNSTNGSLLRWVMWWQAAFHKRWIQKWCRSICSSNLVSFHHDSSDFQMIQLPTAADFLCNWGQPPKF